jgi:hypothetical protein
MTNEVYPSIKKPRKAPGRRVATELQAQILRAQAMNNPEGQAIAMMEFISWSLSNQALINTLKTVKTRTALQKIVDATLRGLRRLMGLPQGTQLDMFANIQWNTAALIQSSLSDMDRLTTPGLVLNQLTGNQNDRLQGLMD